MPYSWENFNTDNRDGFITTTALTKLHVFYGGGKWSSLCLLSICWHWVFPNIIFFPFSLLHVLWSFY